jgi:outer membrane receptor protein involved in Fe transport
VSSRLAFTVSLLAASVLAGGRVVRAQQPQAPNPRDSARQADSVRAAHRIPTVVITGTRLSDVDERTPTRVDPLTLSPIPGPEAVTNALLDLPGVSIYDDEGARLQPELDIRGFSASSIVGTPQGIGVFLDGIRVNEPDAQEVDFDLLPTAAIERASLDRGSNVLFGRNSLGGTLLIATKRGEDQPQMTAEVGAGSYGEQVATVTAGGKLEQFNGNEPPPNTDGFTHNMSGGGTLEWTRPLAIMSVPVGLTVGGEYSRESSNIRLLNVGGGATESVTTLATIHQDNVGAYGQAVVSVTRQLNVTGGLRYDYIHIPYRDGLDSDNDGTSTYNRVSPEIGVTYQFTNDLKGYVAYKSGFRAPAPLELACASPVAPCSLPSALGNDPTLKPVTTRDYETGFTLLLARRTSIDVDGFWTDVFNDIVFASPNRAQVYYINAPQTRRAGVEASGTVGLPQGFYLAGSYSYVAATFQSSVLIASSDPNPEPTKPGDIFPTSPLHRGRVAAGLTRLIGPVLADAEFDIRGYQGQYLRGDESNQRPELPGYTVSGLRGQVEYKRFGVELDIENLFNRQYYTFGIEAPNALIPMYSQVPLNDDNAPISRFVVPAIPRRVTLTFSTRL